MRCQYCNCLESKVIDSRPTEEGNSIRRRRECTRCGRRFTTYEKIELVPLLVVKRDNRREPFDAAKIKSGVIHACEKLPVSMQQIDSIVSRIEQTVYNKGKAELRFLQLQLTPHFFINNLNVIYSLAQVQDYAAIGDMVMAELKQLNDVAYVRFAAVYRKFTDLGSFMEELTHLINENKTKSDNPNN